MNCQGNVFSFLKNHTSRREKIKHHSSDTFFLLFILSDFNRVKQDLNKKEKETEGGVFYDF